MRALAEVMADMAALRDEASSILAHGPKILWFGDAADTGFGTVTWSLATRLLALGADVRCVSDNATGDPIPYPLGERTWDVQSGKINPAAVIVEGFEDGWKPDAAVVLGDVMNVWRLVLDANPAWTRAFASIPTFHYVPVEGVDLPPVWARLWEVVRPVAMSQFGADEIAKVTGSRPPVVYHGVDTEAFYPVAANRPGAWQGKPVTTKEGAKAALHYPADRVMVLRTDRHMPRKMHNRLIRAMVPVFEACPDVDLVLHCRPDDEGGHLLQTISKLPVELQGRVILTRAHNSWKGLPRSALNILYNAADIYATISAEGFGLTPAEAEACGVPVVAMDYSTMPEVVGPAGVLVPPAHLIDNEYDHSWAAVDEEAFAAAVIRLAQKPSLRRALGKEGPRHVAAMFDWDRSAGQFLDLVHAALPQEAAA